MMTVGKPEESKNTTEKGIPDKGGLTLEELELLKIGRSIINRRGRFCPGDIVYLKNKGEHGVVIGEFPLGEGEAAQQLQDPGYLRSDDRRYIVMTVWKEDKEDEDCRLTFRIRYNTAGTMSLIETGPGRAGSEVLEYCENQCLFYPECDELCALRGIYKSKKKKE